MYKEQRLEKLKEPLFAYKETPLEFYKKEDVNEKTNP
jgi:hypothetical protein